MAKIVEFGEERKISGEIWKRVAMVLNPDLLRALEAFKKSSYVVGLVGDDALFEDACNAAEIAMKANTIETVE